jgi:hypothetical protein
MQTMGMQHPACDILHLLYINTNKAFRYYIPNILKFSLTES